MKERGIAELRWRACGHYWRGVRRDCPGVAQLVQRDLVEALLFRHGGSQWGLMDCYRVLSDYHHLRESGRGWVADFLNRRSGVKRSVMHWALSTRKPGYMLDGCGHIRRPWLPDVRRSWRCLN